MAYQSIGEFEQAKKHFELVLKINPKFTRADRSLSMSIKYEINNYQGDLFKRKNKPNPVFYNELKNLLKHFLWNWEEYLEKNKIVF